MHLKKKVSVLGYDRQLKRLRKVEGSQQRHEEAEREGGEGG